MAIYDLYGFLSDDIEAAKKTLETFLDIQFEMRNSDFQGGTYYKWGKTGNENFVLKKNIDPIDGEPAEMSFSEHRILFYVNDTLRSAELRKKINQEAEKFVLLRHEDLQ